MSPKKLRKYPRSVANVVKQAEKVVSYLPDFKGDFIRDYPVVFPERFFTGIDGLILKLRTLPSDVAMRSYLASQTAALGALLLRFDGLYTKLRPSISMAFPEKPEIRYEFGFERKAEIDVNVQTLLVFLTDLRGLCEQHAPELLAVGCPADLLEDFKDLEQECIHQTTLQGAAKDKRRIIADERRETANTLWDELEKLEEHAKAMYGKTSAKASLFKLDRSRKPAKIGTGETGPKPAAIKAVL